MIVQVKDTRDVGETDLKKAQLVMLRLLSVVDAICKVEDLKYWLDCGSLLGAVRHEGFIPWDDDLDIAMHRDDYNKFLEIAGKYLPGDVFLQTPKTDRKYSMGYAKLRDKYSTYLEPGEKEDGNSYHKGIFLDIFPMDLINSRCKKLFFWTKLATNGRFYSRLPKSTYIMQKTLYYSLKLIVGKKGLRNIQRRVYQKCLDKKQELDLCTYGLEIPIKHFLKKEEVFPLSEIEFEGKSYPCPHNPEYYLSVLYENYSDLPPENKRQRHAILIAPYRPCNHPETRMWI